MFPTFASSKPNTLTSHEMREVATVHREDLQQFVSGPDLPVRRAGVRYLAIILILDAIRPRVIAYISPCWNSRRRSHCEFRRPGFPTLHVDRSALRLATDQE